MKATDFNVIGSFIVVVIFFIAAAANGCNACFACNAEKGESTCLDIEGASLQLTVATGTSSRLYALYIALLLVFVWTQMSPMLANKYGWEVAHVVARLGVAIGCFCHFCFPPQMETVRETCTNQVFECLYPPCCIRRSGVGMYKHTSGTMASSVLFWVFLLVMCFLITLQSIYQVATKWGSPADEGGGDKVAAGLALLRLLLFIFTILSISMAAVYSAESDVKDKIFQCEVWSHVLLLLFFMSTFKEQLEAGKKEHEEELAQVTETPAEGTVTTHMSPVHTGDGAKEELPDDAFDVSEPQESQTKEPAKEKTESPASAPSLGVSAGAMSTVGV